MAAVLFGAAGTLAVPMFWTYLVLFAVLCLGASAAVYLLSPDLVRERVRPGAGEQDRVTVRALNLLMFVQLLLAGLDVGRLHWYASRAGPPLNANARFGLVRARNGMTGFARTPVLPEAAPVGPLSALSRQSGSGAAGGAPPLARSATTKLEKLAVVARQPIPEATERLGQFRRRRSLLSVGPFPRLAEPAGTTWSTAWEPYNVAGETLAT